MWYNCVHLKKIDWRQNLNIERIGRSVAAYGCWNLFKLLFDFENISPFRSGVLHQNVTLQERGQMSFLPRSFLWQPLQVSMSSRLLWLQLWARLRLFKARILPERRQMHQWRFGRLPVPERLDWTSMRHESYLRCRWMSKRGNLWEIHNYE